MPFVTCFNQLPSADILICTLNPKPLDPCYQSNVFLSVACCFSIFLPYDLQRAMRIVIVFLTFS